MKKARRDAGFVLPMVLWVCMLIAVTTAGLLALQKHSHRQAHNDLLVAQLRSIDDAAIYQTIHDLNGVTPHLVKYVDDTPTQWSFEGRKITIRVQDEIGKVDLNLADGPLLRRLFLAVGAQPGDADAFADRIMDWREPGAGRRLHGAKRDDYAADSLPYGPREGPFLSVGELRLVLGMSDTLFEQIAPALTVYSEVPSVDQSVAPVLSFMAASGLGQREAVDAIEARNRDNRSGAHPLILAALTGHAITISVETSEGVLTVRRTAIVRLTRHGVDPNWFYGRS